MKKKHFVSLAIVLHRTFRLLSAPNAQRLAGVEQLTAAVVDAVAGWASQQADGFDEWKFREVVRTGKGNY